MKPQIQSHIESQIEVPPVARRSLLVAGAAGLGTFLLDPRASFGQAEGPGPVTDHFPAQDLESVQAVVGASHFSLEKVRELVDERPELAKSAWDWGFGDWESALGAAAHTGNREIAEYLIANGARPNLFTAAMMGWLDAVKVFVAMSPGIQSSPGPHGITLRRHAELGGEPAREVLEYLDELGDADVQATNEPLLLKKEAYVGSYMFGSGPADRFDVAISRQGLVSLQRAEGTARNLFHQGAHVFHPAGAPSARVHFQFRGEVVSSLEIRNPGLVVRAERG